MGHIFISYSTQNSTYANQLAQKLREEGFDVWIDNAKLRASEDWWASIVKALWSCSAFIVLLSPESDQSKWVQRELTIADQRNKPTFPILIGGDMNRPNWQVFVRTQVVFHTDGSLPDQVFYDKLAQIVDRREDGGRDLTADNTAIQNVQTSDDLSAEIADKPDDESILSSINQVVSATDQSTVHMTGQQTIGNQTNIQHQTMNGKESTWNSATIIGTVLAFLALIVGVIAILPEPQRNSILYSIGLSSPTAIPGQTVNPIEQPIMPTDSASTPVPTLITSGESGAYDVTLIYGEQDSFTVLVNQPSTLWNITLDTANGETKNIMQQFPDLALLGDTIQSQTCMQYERSGSSPVLPLGCDGNLVQRQTINGSDVFWYDNSRNQYVNVVLRRDDDAPQLCPHDNGRGRCDFSASE